MQLCNSCFSCRRNPALLELYLENGADPNSTDYNKRTPLHIACAEGLLLIADLLIAYGAETGIRYMPPPPPGRCIDDAWWLE